MTMNTNRTILKGRGSAALVALALTVAGCAGDPAVTGHGSPLLGPDFPPLPEAARGVLDMPSPDCAGRLGANATGLRFEVASLQAGLIAVVDGGGHVVCVDTVSAVQSDLNASGRTAEATAVVDGFLAAVHESDARATRVSGRALPDPEPQPNTQPSRLPDPEPQPN